MKKTLFLLTGVLFVLLFLGCPNTTETPKSNNAYLQSLNPSVGSLTPAFNADTLEYTVIVPNSVTSLTVTGTKADTKATMTPSELSFTGLSVGTSSEQTITVTSEDNSATKEYKVKAVKLGPNATTDGDSEIISLLPVPPGAFQRDGTAANVSIIVKPYSLSKYPITREQFKAIMGKDPSKEDYSSGMNDPVQNVNWYHAIAFCNKLSLLEGLTPAYSVKVEGAEVDWKNLAFDDIPTIHANYNAWKDAKCDWNASGYRLPTEMEWMWAAMGADQDAREGAIQEGINRTGYSKAYAGEGYGTGTSIDAYACYMKRNGGKTQSVGEKEPNELGLHDMSGNVWEWCWDRYDSYPSGIQTGYIGPNSDSDSGSNRVIRGGGWDNPASNCTVAYRYGHSPYGRNSSRGFRVLRPVQ